MADNYVPNAKAKEQISEAMERFEAAKGPHQKFVSLYDSRERAYRGVLRRQSNAAKWKHQIHPPYAFNLIETIIASSVEQGLVLKARPAPRGNPPLEEAMKMLDQAQDVEDIIRHEHRVDEMDDKQRPFYLTAAIGGRGVLKTGWDYSEGMVKRQGVKNVEVHDEDGNLMGTVPTITEITDKGVLRDHSTTSCIDPRDFIIHEGARAVQPWEEGGAQHLFHRMYYSYEQLKMMEAAGFLKNVKYLKQNTRGNDAIIEYNDRTSEVYNLDRGKDQIEVLEYWCMRNGAVYRSWIGNKTVLLREEEETPFWHGGYPFIVGSSMPLPFSTVGMSEIELIEQLQEMLWQLQNQRLDNLELVGNAIWLIKNDVEDISAFKPFPGAVWEVDDPQQVEMMTPQYQVAELSMHAEALLKGDLQNVTSAAPFASGADTQTVDNQTATGASIVMNAAQQRMAYRKYEFQKGLKKEANLRIKNVQQFSSPTYLAHIVGADGQEAFKNISILDLQSDFAFELEPMGESSMRNERRAEAQQFFQVAMAAAPAFAATQQPFNLKELFMWMADKWGVTDAERFFSQDPAALGAMAAQGSASSGGGATGPSPQDAQPNLGVTAGSAVDASSPSAAGGI